MRISCDKNSALATLIALLQAEETSSYHVVSELISCGESRHRAHLVCLVILI